MRSGSNRRGQVRFEVVGSLWGTLDVGAPATIHNLTSAGALIAADRPLAVESLRSMCLVIDGKPAIASAKVCHVNAIDDAPNRYLVGVEFIDHSPTFRDAIGRLLMFRAFPTKLM